MKTLQIQGKGGGEAVCNHNCDNLQKERLHFIYSSLFHGSQQPELMCNAAM